MGGRDQHDFSGYEALRAILCWEGAQQHEARSKRILALKFHRRFHHVHVQVIVLLGYGSRYPAEKAERQCRGHEHTKGQCMSLAFERKVYSSNEALAPNPNI